MKKLVCAISLAFLIAAPATQAVAAAKVPSFTKKYNTHAVDARVLSSKPVYTAGTPVYRKVCNDVEVPIYKAGNNNNQLGNTVAGMVIGGALGQALTGNKNGATAGAIVGGIAGANANSKRIVGYRTERQCETVQETPQNVKLYKSRIRIGGLIYRTRTGFSLPVGDTIIMYMPN